MLAPFIPIATCPFDQAALGKPIEDAGHRGLPQVHRASNFARGNLAPRIRTPFAHFLLAAQFLLANSAQNGELRGGQPMEL
jgi:hypothetical protein